MQINQTSNLPESFDYLDLDKYKEKDEFLNELHELSIEKIKIKWESKMIFKITEHLTEWIQVIVDKFWIDKFHEVILTLHHTNRIFNIHNVLKELEPNKTNRDAILIEIWEDNLEQAEILDNIVNSEEYNWELYIESYHPSKEHFLLSAKHKLHNTRHSKLFFQDFATNFIIYYDIIKEKFQSSNNNFYQLIEDWNNEVKEKSKQLWEKIDELIEKITNEINLITEELNENLETEVGNINSDIKKINSLELSSIYSSNITQDLNNSRSEMIKNIENEISERIDPFLQLIINLENTKVRLYI